MVTVDGDFQPLVLRRLVQSRKPPPPIARSPRLLVSGTFPTLAMRNPLSTFSYNGWTESRTKASSAFELPLHDSGGYRACRPRNRLPPRGATAAHRCAATT